ncbi:uncharacterized protein LOC110252900, partial [Exaiptasia diaphana]|uniref:Uncharacterized protein n=1 Tax=Exaiptasia diaphana TaxID=2652724 RepID=A0A913YVQ3_EXADI
PFWEKVNANPVCFGARDDTFGSFLINVTRGLINEVKLVHLSGGVTCKKGQLSNWGCGDGKLVFKIPSYDPFISAKLKMKLTTPINITAGQEYRLWYGEDFKNVSEGDNSGTACVDVHMYGLY